MGAMDGYHDLVAIAAAAMIVMGSAFFTLGWFHGWKMFINRQETGVATLCLGISIDATLTEEGRNTDAKR